MKSRQPCADLLILLHNLKRFVLADIFPLFFLDQTFIARKFIRFVGRNDLIDGDRRFLVLRNLPACFSAVPFINEIIVPFDQGDFILRRRCVLFLERFFQICEHLCFCQPFFRPFLVLHILRLRLRAKPIEILIAFGIAGFQLRVDLNLIEHFLHLIQKFRRQRPFLRQFPHGGIPVVLQPFTGVVQQILRNPCCFLFTIKSNRQKPVYLDMIRLGIDPGAALLPELQFDGIMTYTEHGKSV